MCLGFVKNYAGFVAVRAILGITEGGLLPGIVSRVLLSNSNRASADWMSGFILVWDVYEGRDGSSIGLVLHSCFS
jgi:hypothetical protein